MSINVENSFIVNYRGIYLQVISAQKKRGIRHPNDRLFLFCQIQDTVPLRYSLFKILFYKIHSNVT